MTEKMPDTVLNEYIEKLGEERGRVFRALESDLYSLRLHFYFYAGLFGTNKERVDLLNSVSGDTAYWIERSMFESIILQICRMTDPAEAQRGRRNVTVRRLPSILSAPDDELLQRLERARRCSAFARDWRNKRIAHTDEEVRLGVAQLDKATRQLVREAIDSIAACIRRFALLEMQLTISTHPIRSLGPDEVGFLKILHLGLDAFEQIKQKKREIMREGDWRKLDELERYPDWLTVRDDPDDDFEAV